MKREGGLVKPGVVELAIDGQLLMLKRMPLGWLFVVFDASGHCVMLPVKEEFLPELRGFLQDAAVEVD